MKHRFKKAKAWLNKQKHTKAAHDMISITLGAYEREATSGTKEANR